MYIYIYIYIFVIILILFIYIYILSFMNITLKNVIYDLTMIKFFNFESVYLYI